MLTKGMDHSLENSDIRMNTHTKKRKPINSSRPLVLLELPAATTRTNIIHVKNVDPEPENSKEKEEIPLPNTVGSVLSFHV